MFEFEEDALAVHAAAVSSHRPIRIDDAVAGDDDGERIARVRLTDRLESFRAVDRDRDVTVAGGFRVRDLRESTPDFELKGGALRRERKVEYGSFARKVFTKLSGSFEYQWAGFVGLWPRIEPNAAKPGTGRFQRESVQVTVEAQDFGDDRHGSRFYPH